MYVIVLTNKDKVNRPFQLTQRLNILSDFPQTPEHNKKHLS